MATSTFTAPELGYDTKQTDYPYEKKEKKSNNKNKNKQNKKSKEKKGEKKKLKLWQGIQHRHLYKK